MGAWIRPRQRTGASEPIRVIRPVVVPAQFFVFGPIVAGFLAIFPGFFTFVLSNMIAMRFEPVLGPALVAFGLAFVVILALIGLKVFYEPGLTSYAIYPDRSSSRRGCSTGSGGRCCWTRSSTCS